MVSSLQNRHSSLAILATLELQLSNPELLLCGTGDHVRNRQ